MTVTGTTAALNVIAADDGGEAALTYTWSALSVPVGKPAPTFTAANGTNAAKNMTATFGGTGVYSVRVTVTDALGLSVTSDVVISVTATLTSLAVTPANVAIAPGTTQLFTVAALDQFGGAMTLPPVTWSASAGSITAGSFTAPAAAGPVTISASNGSISGSTTARVHLVAATPTYGFTLSPHTLSVAFNGDVSASLAAGDFVVTTSRHRK